MSSLPEGLNQRQHFFYGLDIGVHRLAAGAQMQMNSRQLYHAVVCIAFKDLLSPPHIHAELGFFDAGGDMPMGIVWNIRIDPKGPAGLLAGLPGQLDKILQFVL